jgi:hypothetical protein
MRTHLISFTAVLIAVPLASCPRSTETPADAGSRISAQTRQQFDGLYKKWEDVQASPARRFRSDDSYATGPEYEALVAMGKRAVPLLMEKIAAGEFRMNDAVEKITGVDILADVRARPDKSWGPGKPPFGAQSTSKLWIDWWAKNQNGAEWYP